MRGRFLPRGTAASLLAASIAVVACSGGRAESPFDRSLRGANRALIVVDNRNTSISEMTVYLEPSSGVRVRLGTITLEKRRSFTVENLSWGDTFRLMGDPVGSRNIVSRPFPLSRGDVIEWDLDLNRIHYGGGAGG